MSACPVHPSEVRAPRFAELDQLIAAGYGHVPQTKIEALISKNGGLPPVPPPVEDEPTEDDLRSAMAEGKMTARGAVLEAVRRGYRDSREVMSATGLTLSNAAACLCALKKNRKVRIVGEQTTPSGKNKFYLYEVTR